MSFEPQKVIEFDKGKQIGQTLTQHADNIPYKDTTVGAELDSINTHLSALDTTTSTQAGKITALESRVQVKLITLVGIRPTVQAHETQAVNSNNIGQYLVDGWKLGGVFLETAQDFVHLNYRMDGNTIRVTVTNMYSSPQAVDIGGKVLLYK